MYFRFILIVSLVKLRSEEIDKMRYAKGDRGDGYWREWQTELEKLTASPGLGQRDIN